LIILIASVTAVTSTHHHFSGCALSLEIVLLHSCKQSVSVGSSATGVWIEHVLRIRDNNTLFTISIPVLQIKSILVTEVWRNSEDSRGQEMNVLNGFGEDVAKGFL
jgi:hypothetical protein